MNLASMYEAYATLARVPQEGRAAADIAAKQRAEITARLDISAANAKRTTESAVNRLRSDLQNEARGASSRGAIPARGARPSGSAPDFTRVRNVGRTLDELVLERTRASAELKRLRTELAALENLIAREAQNKSRYRRARDADRISAAIAAVAILVSLALGPTILAVLTLTVGASVVGLRLMRGDSAFLIRAAERRPAVSSHPNVRRGLILAVVGWGAAATLVIDLVVTLSIRSASLALEGAPLLAPVDAWWFLGLIAAIVVGSAGLHAQGRK